MKNSVRKKSKTKDTLGASYFCRAHDRGSALCAQLAGYSTGMTLR
jgi:hypothetical protein